MTLSLEFVGCTLILAALGFATTTHAATLTVGPRDGDLVGSDNVVLQSAVDWVAREGGGTVYVKSGAYIMHNSLYLRSRVNVIGLGAAPVLQKADAFASPLAEDAGYALDRVVLQDASGFEKGMGVAFSDDENCAGWAVGVRTITEIEGNTITLDEELDRDYLVTRNGKVESVFPVIFGKRVKRVRLENLVADGNRGANPPLNGCRAGAIYFWKSEHCSVEGCTARNFNGDGISYQVSPYTTITQCRSYRNAALGVHPGSGSHHTEVTDCRIYDNDGIGLFLCWRVKDSRFADNVIEKNGADGISIGHKDTDNLFVGNTIQRNGRHGIAFRAETPANGGHRNTLQDNTIRDNGQDHRADGIHIGAITHDITITGNTIEDTMRDGRVTQQNGIYLAEGVDGVKARGNVIGGHPGEAVVDESKGTRNSVQL